MNAPISFLGRRAVLVWLGLAVGGLAQVEPIVPPARRTQTLEAARQLLAPTTPAPAAVNPFFSAAFDELLAGAPPAGDPGAATTADAATAATPGPKPARNVLQAIAGSLKPRYIEMGGQSMLFFGQKRVKAGGLLTITFEGAEYTLEVTAIDRTNFTLRLNREEFTRPIK